MLGFTVLPETDSIPFFPLPLLLLGSTRFGMGLKLGLGLRVRPNPNPLFFLILLFLFPLKALTGLGLVNPFSVQIRKELFSFLVAPALFPAWWRW